MRISTRSVATFLVLVLACAILPALSWAGFHKSQVYLKEDVFFVGGDRKGDMVALGTSSKGLYLYDARRRSLRPAGFREVVGKKITAVAYGATGGELWIGTFLDGLYLITGSTVRHFNNRVERALPSDRITALVYNKGRLWIGTDRGLVSFRSGAFQPTTVTEEVKCIAVDPSSDRVYVGHGKARISIVDRGSVRTVTLALPRAATVRFLAWLAKKNVLLVGTFAGLFRVNSRLEDLKDLTAKRRHHKLMNMVALRNGRAYVCVPGRKAGIFELTDTFGFRDIFNGYQGYSEASDIWLWPPGEFIIISFGKLWHLTRELQLADRPAVRMREQLVRENRRKARAKEKRLQAELGGAASHRGGRMQPHIGGTAGRRIGAEPPRIAASLPRIGGSPSSAGAEPPRIARSVSRPRIGAEPPRIARSSTRPRIGASLPRIGGSPSPIGVEPPRIGGSPSSVGAEPPRIARPSTRPRNHASLPRIGGSSSRTGSNPPPIGGSYSPIGAEPPRIGGFARKPSVGAEPPRIGGSSAPIGAEPPRIGGFARRPSVGADPPRIDRRRPVAGSPDGTGSLRFVLQDRMVGAVTVTLGKVWFGTDDGDLYSYGQDGRAQKERNFSGGISALRMAAGGLWIGTDRGELVRFNGFNIYRTIRLEPAPEGAPRRIFSIAAGGNTVWVGTDRGLFAYRAGRGSWQFFGGRHIGFRGSRVTAVAVDESERVWVGSPWGVARREGQSWRVFTPAVGVPSGAVTCLAPSGQGAIWCGTRQGVASFDGRQWSSIPGLTALWIERGTGGRMLVGGQGLAIVDPSGGVRRHPDVGNVEVVGLADTVRGLLVASSQGLFLTNGSRFR